MNDARTIISMWPSVSDFAKDIGVEYQTAYRMKTRNSINAKYWAQITSSAATRGIKGVSLDILVDMARSCEADQ